MTDQVTTRIASVSLACDIVSSYVAHNSTARGELAALIVSIYAEIERLHSGAPRHSAEKPRSIRRSATDDCIVRPAFGFLARCESSIRTVK